MGTRPRPDHGRQIAAARAVLRMSTKDLAAASGLHEKSVSYNERKRLLPRYAHAADSIGKALTGLGVSFETRAGGGFAVVFSAAAVEASPTNAAARF